MQGGGTVKKLGKKAVQASLILAVSVTATTYGVIALNMTGKYLVYYYHSLTKGVKCNEKAW